MAQPSWWRKPRKISVVVDNESWILPFAKNLVAALKKNGDNAKLVRKHKDVMNGAVAFYLGCTQITPPEILGRNKRNLVVHESDLPEGKGFAPMTWQILQGKKRIPVCLIEAIDDVDAGNIIYRDEIVLKGDELHDEWRVLQGKKTVELGIRFMKEKTPQVGKPQKGKGSVYKRRRPENSKLDMKKTLEAQFDLLRVCSNEHYPAFFEHKGKKYIIKIEKAKK